jgi:dolichyl-phosphate-mannose--protein O-mannosyl transferase
MFLKRTSFIYYLYSVTPFMILAITWALDAALRRPEKSLKRLVWIYLVLVIGLFILFYPAISGLEIHRDYTYRYLLWYQSWDF